MKNLSTGRARVFLMIFCVFGIASSIHAQKDSAEKIDKIRQIYQRTNRQIAAAEKNFPESEVFFSELTVNKGGTMYPAVGNFRSVYSFYYTYGDREIDPYPNRLLKVMVATDRAARREYAEYLFDEAGKLIFYFEKMSDEPESRFYFSGGKTVRIQRGEKIVDINSRAESAASKTVQAQAARIVQIFRNSIN
jgi:hypothetical protein